MYINIKYIIFFLIIIYGPIANAQHSVLITPTAEDNARLIFPDDIVYLGAFRFPKTSGDASKWPYGGSGFTYYPHGDPAGDDDGHPGSLYGIGHDHHQLVSEISIPEPVISGSKNAAELNIAKTLQPFSDITDGLRAQVGVDKVGGLAYLPKQGGQLTDKIYWTIYEYYNADGVDYLSHGWSELNLSNVQAQGVWHVGPIGNSEFHSMRTADYIFEISKTWADLHVPGKYLGSGRVREAGAFGSSEGPALFAFGPYNDGNPPANGAELDAIPLIWYPKGNGLYPDYSECDRWGGGAWLTAGNKSSVVFVGSKGLGDTYYGEARGGDCSSSKGYHCTPYEPQFIFYDPEDLAAVASGGMEPYEVVPYLIFRPEEFMWDGCRINPSGVAYDRERGLLYVTQFGAERVTDKYESYPLVHVFSITGDGIIDTTPPTITSVSASNSTQTIVVFSETIEHASATNVSNYSINNGIIVSDASLGSDLRTVTLTTSSHTEGVSYTLTVSNVKDRAINPNTITTNTQTTYTVVLPDTQAPSIPTNLTAVQAVSSSQINLVWNVSTDNIGVAGYKIYKDGIQITTTSNTSYQDTGLSLSTTYSYTVSAYDAAGNESGQSTASQATTTGDTTPPTISSASVSGDTKVIITFSEPVELSSVTNTSNYSINNGIIVSGASLGSDLKTVTLTTSSHTESVSYTLTVNNIKDRASIPNMIASNTQVTYTFLAQLIISNLTAASGKTYEVVQDGLQTGALVYIDRTYTFSTVPTLVKDATYIKTANDDKNASGTSFITFDVHQDVVVYVAHDDRISTKPSWISSFSDTGDNLVTTDTTFSIFAKDHAAGTITLGGNEAGYSMFTVIIVEQETEPVSDTVPPFPPQGLSTAQ